MLSLAQLRPDHAGCRDFTWLAVSLIESGARAGYGRGTGGAERRLARRGAEPAAAVPALLALRVRWVV